MEPTEASRPRVFLSHAGDDSDAAERLRKSLLSHGIHAFAFRTDIGWGADFVLAVNETLTQSDYCVLLWSHACVGREWVDAEWAASFAREMNEQRRFIFVVRLDDTSPPLLLSTRKYLDASDGDDWDRWDRVADELAAVWRRDRAAGQPILPVPRPSTDDEFVGLPPVVGGNQIINLYIRNRDLWSAAHVVAVSVESTGSELERLVRARLDLPERWKGFGGAMGAYFSYRFMCAGAPIPADSRLSALHIADGSVIDLEVDMNSFGPDGFSSADYRYRDRSGASVDLPESPADFPPLTPAQKRIVVKSAFRHLMPW